MRRTEPIRTSATPRRAAVVTLLLVALSSLLPAQPASLPFVVRATTTTGGKVFPNPTSASSTVRNTSVPLNGWYGAAVELLVPVTHEISLTAAVEVLRSVDEGLRPVSLGGALVSVPVRDGYVIIPLEVGIAAGIPISDEAYRLTMSGGIGVTLASRIQEVAGVTAETEGLPAAYGIFVGVAFEVRIWSGVYGHLSTRFRDPEVDVTSRFTEPSAVHNGRTYLLPPEPTTTRLNVDGLSVSAGLMVDLRRLF